MSEQTPESALKAHIDALSLDGQLFDAAKRGDVAALDALLDEHPHKLQARNQPYEHTLLHVAASAGHLPVVDLLLRRGLDTNVREKGDNTYPMHWAAAAGHLDVVRRLADAGGDVIGHGDDHELEVIGWATCWDEGVAARQRAIADLLVSRGARHHIFSAIALDLGDEVRRIVSADPRTLNRRMSRNENNQTPLHFAVRMKRPEMVALLLELGADPLAVDGSGDPVAAYVETPGIDRAVMQAIRAMTLAELESARRGKRSVNGGPMDLVAALSLADWDTASRLVHENPGLIERGRARSGVLHLMARRNDAAAVTWLLDHGADPNARWEHWEAEVTPLHFAAGGGHADIVKLLLARGADATIRDTRFDADALGWAQYFEKPEIIRLLEAHSAHR